MTKIEAESGALNAEKERFKRGENFEKCALERNPGRAEVEGLKGLKAPDAAVEEGGGGGI